MRHSIWRDGIIAGAVGATAVAGWFFFIDLMHDQPFFTPDALGRALLAGFGMPSAGSRFAVVTIYTVAHYAAFVGIATIAAVIVHWGERQPGVLAGAFILFIAVEVGFYGLTGVLAQGSGLGVLAWQQVAVGNLIAAFLMGTYLWRAHPQLRYGLDLALSGRDVR